MIQVMLVYGDAAQLICLMMYCTYKILLPVYSVEILSRPMCNSSTVLYTLEI